MTVPVIKRFQKTGVCKACSGAIHFYPAPVSDEQAIAEGHDPSGEWVHLNPADWTDNPHQAEPA
ncbi:Uncharacterised protein [Mycobacteroides abscessus subsp. massiliense]|nr:hypothetical protein [Mycobacteroides abscessus]SKU84140.1 Uncharacterised protein [Mycobacteroides abscessus subsp. massiliense]SKU93031.1 Uncharacterised protein [Mycobacteroides abscessus subsp. massiliense]SLF10838.1 Uncharacterised protein [Mycobacteroides abscessus subsp. massiliense]SLG79049.1 Uncharacterised protein [Mycobacteroides abscessus subsp. massiliense]SLI13068.1 Uncharacterised protein [Mycobacteroides abscessus subsp. massiliense]